MVPFRCFILKPDESPGRRRDTLTEKVEWVNVNSIFAKSATTSSWGYEDGPWQGPGPPLLGAADLVIELALNLG